MRLAVSKQLQDLTVVMNGLVEAIVVPLDHFVDKPFDCVSLLSKLQVADARFYCSQDTGEMARFLAEKSPLRALPRRRRHSGYSGRAVASQSADLSARLGSCQAHRQLLPSLLLDRRTHAVGRKMETACLLSLGHRDHVRSTA